MTNIPQHVGIIMDGNRRWAKAQGLNPLEGHKMGLENAETIARHAFARGVKYLTLFAFSTENWERNHLEVLHLLGLFKEALSRIENFPEEGIRVRFLGDLSRFPGGIEERALIISNNVPREVRATVSLCLNYGGRNEIIRAIRSAAQSGVSLDEIDEEFFGKFLDTDGMPDLDLVIRTSGELRLSNFLIWQTAYSELIFSERMWPAFSTDDFDEALQEFAGRQRRLGR